MGGFYELSIRLLESSLASLFSLAVLFFRLNFIFCGSLLLDESNSVSSLSDSLLSLSLKFALSGTSREDMSGISSFSSDS